MRFYKSGFHTRKDTSVMKDTQVFIRTIGFFFSDLSHIRTVGLLEASWPKLVSKRLYTSNQVKDVERSSPLASSRRCLAN